MAGLDDINIPIQSISDRQFDGLMHQQLDSSLIS